MRIIDKNTDFYDYLQNVYRDASITFDRTDSFLLTKDAVRDGLRLVSYSRIPRFKFMLLQVCNTFWLFLVRVEAGETEDGSDWVKDYSLDLLCRWKNYGQKRCLIRLSIIEFDYAIKERLYDRPYAFRGRDMSEDLIIDHIPILVDAIDTNNLKRQRFIDTGRVSLGNGKTEYRHIPILKACGIAHIVDPLDIYLSLEEYFSLERQSQERTESTGITDKEKIENHGFDTKISFRGKAGKGT